MKKRRKLRPYVLKPESGSFIVTPEPPGRPGDYRISNDATRADYAHVGARVKVGGQKGARKRLEPYEVRCEDVLKMIRSAPADISSEELIANITTDVGMSRSAVYRRFPDEMRARRKK